MPLEPIDISTYRGQLGFNLRRLRLKRFSTQVEFKQQLEHQDVYVHHNTISNWERGIRTPPLELLPAIARCLSCKPQDLVPDYIAMGPDAESARYRPK